MESKFQWKLDLVPGTKCDFCPGFNWNFVPGHTVSIWPRANSWWKTRRALPCKKILIGNFVAQSSQFWIGKLVWLLSRQNTYYVIPASYTKNSSAKRSSAEWIVEAPSSNAVLPLANFGTVAFTNCSATIKSTTGSISNAHWKNDPLTMKTKAGIVKATPSTLSGDGTSFSVSWSHQ